jgi:thiol-disulfide isomerase/thioredoxin
MRAGRIGLRLTIVVLLLSCGGLARAAGAAPSLDAYRGHVTYVDFWASWCGPCAESFPWLNAMQAKYGAHGLRIVGVGVDTQSTNADRFLKAHPPQFPIVRDPDGALAEHYAIEGMPYAILLDASGHVLSRHSGFRAGQTDEYEQAIQDALSTEGVAP